MNLRLERTFIELETLCVPKDHRVLIISIPNESILNAEHSALLRGRLPVSLLPDIDRYYKWQDRQAALLGRAVVQVVMRASGEDEQLIASWSLSSYNRPSLAVPFDFNISHCPGRVVVAFRQSGRVGIDIEPLRDIRPYDFRNVLTAKELGLLERIRGRQQRELFATIWTRKEAAIKADGKGFSNTLTTVSALGTTIHLDGKRWETVSIPMPEPYICHMATPTNVPEIVFLPLTIEQLTGL